MLIENAKPLLDAANCFGVAGGGGLLVPVAGLVDVPPLILQGAEVEQYPWQLLGVAR